MEVREVTKRFGAVTALDGVSLALHRGEVLALLGDNGAGKSTLVKCLSGVHRPDEGEIYLEGEAFAVHGPAEARARGIETVYQDLALFDNLSAAGNFFAGREVVSPPALKRVGLLRKSYMRRHTEQVMRDLQVGFKNVNLPVGLLSGGQRQAIAVARAQAFASRVMILDEPTAALGLRESRNVLRLISRLPESGVSVILISHNLEHVMQVADRAVVLRQGKYVGSATPTEDNHELLVSLIVGGGERG